MVIRDDVRVFLGRGPRRREKNDQRKDRNDEPVTAPHSVSFLQLGCIYRCQNEIEIHFQFAVKEEPPVSVAITLQLAATNQSYFAAGWRVSAARRAIKAIERGKLVATLRRR